MSILLSYKNLIQSNKKKISSNNVDEGRVLGEGNKENKTEAEKHIGLVP